MTYQTENDYNDSPYRGEGSVSIQEEAALYHLVAQSTSTAPAHPVWLPPPLLPAWPALHYLMTLPVFHGEYTWLDGGGMDE